MNRSGPVCAMGNSNGIQGFSASGALSHYSHSMLAITSSPASETSPPLRLDARGCRSVYKSSTYHGQVSPGWSLLFSRLSFRSNISFGLLYFLHLHFIAKSNAFRSYLFNERVNFPLFLTTCYAIEIWRTFGPASSAAACPSGSVFSVWPLLASLAVDSLVSQDGLRSTDTVSPRISSLGS